MTATTRPLDKLTIADLMSREVITIPENMSLRAAAHLLFKHQITGAPVVDADGRCIGMLSASDFVHWTDEGATGAEQVPLQVCPYQVKGRLITGEDAMICTLAEDSCPWQEMRPGIGGGHTAVCLRGGDTPPSWQRATIDLTTSGVRRYMTADIVTARPDMPLSELACSMIDAHIHRIVVVDAERRPIGIVSSTDLMAALAHGGCRP